MRHAAAHSEKFGRVGGNLYRCKGYIAGLHSESDASRGLCCQIDWDGIRDWDEFGFVYLEYGIYIAIQENTFWSFDANMVHGTLLPRQETVLCLRGGANVSNGEHLSIRSKDARRAERRAEVEKSQYLCEALFAQ
ncbi:hypothetical protein VKT23_020005 [Stygiomarasmius scandens]|uniref:Uncharacterized protein n=1 Tax=Marasmiellus scandens TaxID=2682957 RepID=A0ABR1IM50_9AGAR